MALLPSNSCPSMPPAKYVTFRLPTLLPTFRRCPPKETTISPHKHRHVSHASPPLSYSDSIFPPDASERTSSSRPSFSYRNPMGIRPARYSPTSAEAGRSRVWCHGLCMTGPDYRGTLLTLVLAIVIFAAECGVSFPWLVANKPALGIPLIIVMAITFVVTVSAAYLASTTDPGIIPRASSAPQSIITFPTVRERAVSYRGRLVTLKYCDTCRIWRPPRSSHCATCNNCVRRFDHHCPWLGNDVGLRNYRSYFTFVVFASIAASVAIATSVLTIHFTTAHYRGEFPNEPYLASIRRALGYGGTSVNIVLVFLCLMSLLFTGGLTGFHIYLMSNNVTTAESFKKRARNSAHAQDDLRGCAAICLLQCTQRDESALTNGHTGPAYPEERELVALIDSQVAQERDTQSVISPPPRAAIPPINLNAVDPRNGHRV